MKHDYCALHNSTSSVKKTNRQKLSFYSLAKLAENRTI